jgi:hypothetical protein
MSQANWFYSRGQERSAALTLAQLRDLVESGQVGADDLVWTAGMSEWAAARDVSALQVSAFPVAATAPPPAAAPASATAAAMPISYYQAGGGMPRRALDTLHGHARPTGDTGDWPLDDQRVSQFEAAVKLRKRVTGAANLYRALLLLTIIGGVIFLLVGLFTVAAGGRASGAASVGMFAIVVVLTAFAALYYFTWRATTRSQRWAPLTMFIIFLASGLLNVLSIMLTAVNPTSTTAAPQVVGGLVSVIFAAAFAAVSWRSFTAIAKYLAQPAWCQELMVKAQL